MTTKAPSAVRPMPADSLEHIAYASVAGIPTLEPHDADRLGFSVWLWLKNRKDTLATAVHTTGARFLIPEGEALQRITDRLKEQGIEV
jgi:hypothetical protein